MNSSFKRNLIIGFGFSLLLLVISSVASYMSIRNLLKSAEQVEHTNQVIRGLDKVVTQLINAETGQRGYLLTGEDNFLQPYQGAIDDAKTAIADVRKLTMDHNAQQLSLNQLQEIVVLRLSMLQKLIMKKQRGQQATAEELQEGKQYMDQARAIIAAMVDRENQLLLERTTQMNRFAGYTPTLIVIAALLSIILTVISFARVSSDFERTTQLQLALQEKDQQISRRINLIQEVAGKVSTGDYSVRVQETDQQDTLGNLAVSLNQMAHSLETSFNSLADKEWLQAGIASLNEQMLGEYELPVLTRNIIEYVADYTGSQVGAFYVSDADATLKFTKGFAYDESQGKTSFNIGEGLVGQAASGRKLMRISNVQPDQMLVSHATGQILPKNIVAIPLLHERKVMGVMELASIREYNTNEMAFLENISHIIGTVLNSVENRKRLQELLEETQSQSEELQAQHNELENINSELEAQTEKLQASEEELKVQQEELLEANEELEERARLLEEKNQLVFERNIEIQRKAEELEQSTRYKSEFLANMSHELRTPLNSILLLSRLMSENNENNLNSEQIEYARVIQGSGQGLLALIDEILDLSKIEAGKMELLYSDVPVKDVLEDMSALFTPIAKEKGIEFRTSIGEHAQRIIETDRLRLEQIIKNLIANALKFTSQGFVELQVSMTARNSNHISISVHDTGIGIAPEKQQLIFDAFRQADGSTRRKYGGTGLGLSISRELARLLGGEIMLQSEPGKGSIFTIDIPVSKAAAAIHSATEEELHAGEQLTTPTLKPLIPEKEIRQRYISDVIPDPVPDDRNDILTDDRVILIVEDDTNFAESLLKFTRRKGYKGVVAVRGDEALDLAVKFRPAGILLDIQLPVKDGWEVMEELKNNTDTRHIPVHMMSAYDGKYKSLSKGAVDFINKPVAYEQMQDIFERIEFMLNNNPRKVLIVEENLKHAKALAFYLENYAVNTEIRNTVNSSVEALQKQEVNCVILDMGVPNQRSYDTLEQVKKQPGLENIPIIIFTGRNLSKAEEVKIKQYADSIVIKTAHSYQRILDEVSLFLHLVEEKNNTTKPSNNLGVLQEVLKNKTVLIADDDIRNIYSLTKALETYQMKVVSATDGKEALQQLQEHPETDIVLMDMMMPEMDGYESTRRIKSNPKFKRVPVIAVTAKAMIGDREKCIEAGASDYISKPVDIDQLLSLLRVWLYDSAK
ncbi:response regulator [Pseudobacter ginsenosidimutans]|uniref:histidine kinase n=1 Tax=Pseudobacter ginsenosidimutans TaxID=661488 RepID=A0A4Q7N5I6_9BACT|nr:response regulator [Pseudobacter ginsenosidimutans]QEC44775.1 response regulator [Pseudobacter ginsenosidimutans]RZS76260.1 signal transduction histidine kinase [Pseudobacter ginsenosidimutans]